MKVMVVVKASPESEAGVMPSAQLLSDMGKFNEQLVAAGVMLTGEGLHPSSKAARVRFAGSTPIVTAGPFAETRELIAGFWIWQVKSMEDAIEWAKRAPMLPDDILEIRPFFEAADFGAALTPEIQEREERLRAELERTQLDPPRFEEASQRVVAGLNGSYTFESRSDIPAQWHQFVPRLHNMAGLVGSSTYGVCWNYREGAGFDYLTGVEVTAETPLPADFGQVTLPAGRYAVFTHRKHVSAIPETLDTIWTKWLPNSGYQAAATPCFERYTAQFNPQTGLGGTEIWIALQG